MGLACPNPLSSHTPNGDEVVGAQQRGARNDWSTAVAQAVGTGEGGERQRTHTKVLIFKKFQGA